MPTPAKTSREALIAIALTLVEANGADALTIGAVAEAAGVRGPSLYKHFSDRTALLSAVTVATMQRLEAVLRDALAGRTSRARLVALATAYRQFARRSPHLYQLMYRPEFADVPSVVEASRVSGQPLFEELQAAGVPPKRLLNLSRMFVAFVHGFVSMEIVGAFRLGGDVDRAFEEGIKTLLQLV